MNLYNYKTGEFIRAATVNEALASEEAAKHDGGSGIITVEIDGVPTSCYVIG
jgi:hypothetical protein